MKKFISVLLASLFIISSFSFSLPAGAADTTTYWKEVTDVSELNDTDNFIIVSCYGSTAVSMGINNSTSPSSTVYYANYAPNNPSYGTDWGNGIYSLSGAAGQRYTWYFSSSVNGLYVTNRYKPNSKTYYIRLNQAGTTSIVSTNATGVDVTAGTTTENSWRIYRHADNTSNPRFYLYRATTETSFSGLAKADALALTGNNVAKIEFKIFKQIDAYKITLKSDKGLFSDKNYVVYPGESLPDAPSFTGFPGTNYSGYTFLGWYDSNNNQVTEAQMRDAAINGNTTFTAKHEPIRKVTLNANYDGGPANKTYNVTNNQPLSSAGTVTFPDVSGRTGYEFLGWRKDSPDSGTLLTEQQVRSSVITADTTFYAVWEEKFCDITLDPGDYTGASANTLQVFQYKTLDDITGFRFPNWKYEGHVFAGWKDADTDEVYTNEELRALTITEGKTFVAQWETLRTVSFDYGTFADKIEASDPLSVVSGTVLSESDLPVPLWTSSGDALPFLGWYTDTNFTTKYTGGAVTADMTLYPKFDDSDEAFYVYYYDYPHDGIDVVLRTVAVAEGECATNFDISKYPAPEGIAWSGYWYDNSALSGSPVDFTIPVSDMLPEGENNLYLWPGIDDICRVVFITGGERIAPETVVRLTDFNVDSYTPEREGSQFAGWYLDEALTQPVSGNVQITQDTYLYAKWVPNYVQFIPVLHSEKADSYNYLSEKLLGSGRWYALTGSTVYVKTEGTTHTVWCKLPGDNTEYPVYDGEPTNTNGTWTGTQATLDDVYKELFIFANEGTPEWENFIEESGRTGEKPVGTDVINANGTTIVPFTYIRTRLDVEFHFDNSKCYVDFYDLAQKGIIRSCTATETGNNSCTGTFNDGGEFEYIAANGTTGTDTLRLLNVKFDEEIADRWPVSNWVTMRNPNTLKFSGFTCEKTSTGGGTLTDAISKLFNLTRANYHKVGRNAEFTSFASKFTGTNSIGAIYAIECVPGETPDFTIDGIGYRIEDDYSQLLMSGTAYLLAKSLMGCSSSDVLVKLGSSITGSSRIGEEYTSLFEDIISEYPYSVFEGRTSLNEFNLFTVFIYRRNVNSIVFDLAYDANANGTNEIITYNDILYGQKIGDYKYAMPGYATLPQLTREGWKFLGWVNEYGELYTDDDWAEMSYENDTDNSGMVFTARWEAINGNVIEFYDSEFATYPSETHVFVDGDFVPVPTYTEPDLGWVWENRETYQTLAYTGDVPLYGQYGDWEYTDVFDEERWVIKVYGKWSREYTDVVYDVNVAEGGYTEYTPVDSNRYYIGNTSVSVKLLNPTDNRSGKVFVGWKLDKNGVIYQPGNHVPVNWAGTMKFTAQWVEPDLAVYLKYDANGGAGPNGETQYPHGDGIAFKKGYSLELWDNKNENNTDYFVWNRKVLIGWNTEPDGSGTTYMPYETLELTEDTTLYAMWEDVVYLNVTYHINNGYTVTEGLLAPSRPKISGAKFNNYGTDQTHTEEYEYGSHVAIMPGSDVFCQTCKFMGWYDNDHFTGNPITDIASLTKHVDLYAKWMPYTLFVRGTKFDLTVGGETICENQANKYNEVVDFNTAVNVNFKGSETFFGWVNATGKLLGTTKSLDFQFYSVSELKAISSSKDDISGVWKYVVFRTYDKDIVKSCFAVDSSDIEFPVETEIPIKLGYKHIGWSVVNEDGTIGEEVYDESTEGRAGIEAALAAAEGTLMLEAVYEDNENTYTLIIHDPKNGLPTRTITKTLGDGYDITAVGDGFSYWIDANGNIVSYYKVYDVRKFYAETYEYTAVYDVETPGKAALVNDIQHTYKSKDVAPSGKNEVAFTVTVAIPEDWTIVEMGVLYTTKGAVGTSYDNFQIDRQNVSKYKSEKTFRSGTVTINLATSTTNDAAVFYGRGYVICFDANGERQYAYSQIAYCNTTGTVYGVLNK